MTSTGSPTSQAPSQTRRQQGPALISRPTPQQTAVLGLLAQDRSWPEIAGDLGITVSSARSYAQQATNPLGVSSLPAAMAMVCAHNYIVMPGDRIAIPGDVLASAIQVLTRLAHDDLSQRRARELAAATLAELTRHAAPPG